jgi:hypothetical protein
VGEQESRSEEGREKEKREEDPTHREIRRQSETKRERNIILIHYSSRLDALSAQSS